MTTKLSPDEKHAKREHSLGWKQRLDAQRKAKVEKKLSVQQHEYQRNYQKQWRAKNKEKAREYNRRWYEKNKEIKKAAVAAWRNKSSERVDSTQRP